VTDQPSNSKSPVINLNEHRARANEAAQTPLADPLGGVTQRSDRDCLSLVADRLFSRLLADTEATPQSSSDLLNILAPLSQIQPLTEQCAAQRLENRFAFASRGQQLSRRTLATTEHLAIISRAILAGHCLEARYNHRDRVLHPYALLVREPKVYLLAVEHLDDIDSNTNPTPEIRQFLCHRFEHLAPSNLPSVVPEDFSIHTYLDNGALEVPIHALQASLPEPFTLTIRLRAMQHDNLLRDLEEFPIAGSQTLIRQTPDSDDYLLEVPGQRANVSLLGWIMARHDRAEVLAPALLRQYIGEKLRVTANLYSTPVLAHDVAAQPVPTEIDVAHDSTEQSHDNAVAVQADSAFKQLQPLPARIDLDAVAVSSQLAARDRSNVMVSWMIKQLLMNTRLEPHMESNFNRCNARHYMPRSMKEICDDWYAGDFQQALVSHMAELIQPVYDDQDWGLCRARHKPQSICICSAW